MQKHFCQIREVIWRKTLTIYQIVLIAKEFTRRIWCSTNLHLKNKIKSRGYPLIVASHILKSLIVDSVLYTHIGPFYHALHLQDQWA